MSAFWSVSALAYHTALWLLSTALERGEDGLMAISLFYVLTNEESKAQRECVPFSTKCRIGFSPRFSNSGTLVSKHAPGLRAPGGVRLGIQRRLAHGVLSDSGFQSARILPSRRKLQTEAKL